MLDEHTVSQRVSFERSSPYVQFLHVFVLVLELPDLAEEGAEHRLHLESDLRVGVRGGELLVQLVDLLLAAEHNRQGQGRHIRGGSVADRDS